MTSKTLIVQTAFVFCSIAAVRAAPAVPLSTTTHANDYATRAARPLPPRPVKYPVPADFQKTTVIALKVVQNLMQYDKKTFTVKAGQKVSINFENPDFMQHNLVILAPGSRDKVGAATDQMVSDPDAAQKNYIPKMPEVLFSTKLLAPSEKITLQFTAPSKAGDYPYICTFPGHWRIMNGVMKVVK